MKPEFLFLDKSDILWVSTEEGLTSYDYKTGQFETFTRTDGLQDEEIRRVGCDMSGNLWISYWVNGVSRLSNGKFTFFAADHGLTGKGINAIIEDQKGNLLFGARDKGVFIFKDGRFSPYPLKELENLQVIDMKEDRKGSLWIGTTQGIFKVTGSNIARYNTGSGLSDDNVRVILEDSERNLWVGTDMGLNRLKHIDDGIIPAFETILLSSEVVALFEDKEKNLWVGTDNEELKQIKDCKFISYKPPGSHKEGIILSFFEDRNKDTWIGTMKGKLFHFRGGKIIEILAPPGLSGAGIIAIGEDSEGNLWLGTIDNGVFQKKEEKYSQYTVDNGLSNNTVTSIFRDSTGDLWFGTFDGVTVFRYRSCVFETITSGSGLSGKVVSAIIEVPHEENFARRGTKIFATKALRHQGTKNQPVTGRLPFVSWCLRVLVAKFMAVRNFIFPLDKVAPEDLAARGTNEDPSIDSSRRSHHSSFSIHHSTRARPFLVTLPFWIITGIYILLHNRFSGVQAVVTNFSLKDFFSIMKTIGVYTKVILTPFFPTPHFPMQMFDQNHLEFLLYFAAAVGILVFMLVHREEYKNSLYTLIFLIFLLPVLDPEIVPSYPKIVLRFAYIPALFAGIFLVDTFYLLKNKRLRHYYVALLAIIAVIWGVESYRYQVYFKDSTNHYRRLTPYYPEDCSLLLPLALITAEEGDYGRALELVNRALVANEKDRWLDISDMGGLLKANLLVVTGDLENGKTLAEKILGETRSDEMKYFGNLVLSKYYDKKGDLAAALELLNKAGKIGETADLYFRMALVYAKMKNDTRALYYIEKAIVLNPVMKKYREFKDFLRGRQARGRL